ncbi:hypothetical protein FHL15_008632 [Xylaria flabelliformis]|uniref:C2H2-type domain-containing protein n=1 Tax=Xylaria flabelliformis TaxID=2512241 RepID=A0A553HR76_9PEZI|nr:hypothetical protein FHL15_008632 [Xylaria flabelliformis]
MSQWEKTSTASQIDRSNNTDMPDHKLPDTSSHIPQYVQPITTPPHARLVASPLGSAVQRDFDQDVCVCVCIACRTCYRNNTALRQHGAKENHRPYGCVCGGAFARLDALERHIASKNKVTRFYCPLCEHDETRAFARADHLPQHLRTFHKIPAGRIPQDFTSSLASDGPAEDSIPAPQSFFPCLIPGCIKTGELAYLRQIDLEEHMALAHCAHQNAIPVQQQLSNPVPTWTNFDFQQNAADLTFLQDAQQNGLLEPAPAGNYQAYGEAIGIDGFVGNSVFPIDNEFDIGFY